MPRASYEQNPRPFPILPKRLYLINIACIFRRFYPELYKLPGASTPKFCSLGYALGDCPRLSRLPPKQVAHGQSHQEETHGEIKPADASTVDHIKDSVIAAAVHCIALDDSGDFPANRELGLFEVDSPGINDLEATPASSERLRVSKAQIEFSAQRQQEGGRDSPLGGAFDITVLLQVAVEGGGRGQGLRSELATPGIQNRENIPMSSGAIAVSSQHESPIFFMDWEEVGPAVAAAAAAASVTDRAEAQAAISAIACWNILAATGKMDVSTVTVELAAVFGNGGDLYATNQDIHLKRNGALQAAHSPFLASSRSTFLATENRNDHPDQHEPPVLGATLEWRLQDGIGDKLDEFAVADVKVYTKAPATSTDTSILSHSENSASPSMPPPSQQQLLLHGTLCKRASDGFGQTDPSEKEPASLQAVLMPYAEQRPHARYSVTSPVVRDGSVPTAELVRPDHKVKNGALTATSSTTSVVSEIEDREWWKELEDQQRGRGMEAVHALSRDPDWKPGRWRILRERRRKQREERERRRMMETARRREETHVMHGHSTASHGEAGCGGIVGSVARRIWRAMQRQWNRFRR